MRRKAPKVDIPRAKSIGFKPRPALNRKLTTAIIIIAILFAISYIFSNVISSTSDIKTGNVAVIKIRDVITIDGVDTPFIDAASSEEIIDLIDAAEANPEVQAILIDINSPGGSPVASDEIQMRVNEINKTTIALIRDLATSGAYWVASAADKVVASKFSVVGSIGVRGSYVELTGLLEKYNLTYRRIVGGEYKDIGSPLKEATEEEERILQNLVNDFHSEFIASIAANRNLNQVQINTIRTAEIFSGRRAKEVGLVDVLGNEDTAIGLIESELNITAQAVEYKKEKTFWQQVRELTYRRNLDLQSQVKNVESKGVVVEA